MDLTDIPLYSSLVPQYQQSSSYYVTSAPEGGIIEIDFNMANNFWGCNFNFGNSTCGVQIRQGIAHLMDKASFSANEAEIAGYATPIDNLSGLELATPNPCGWDASFLQTGSSCVVGSSGGTAYHLQASTGVNYAWQPALGSPDFCAAAQHFINAGLATSKNGSTCILSGISSTVTSNTVKFFVRNDNLALDQLGAGISEEICALFGQGFTNYCPPYLVDVVGGVNAFSGFATTSSSQPNLTWWIYTNGAGSFGTQDLFSDVIGHYSEVVPEIDLTSSMSLGNVLGNDVFSWWDDFYLSGYFDHSQCASNRSSYTPGDYSAVCNPAYDNVASTIYFAPCLNASGDPVAGQTTPTFADCPGTSQLTATSAGYQADDIFGRNVYAIPIVINGYLYSYLSNWSRVISNQHSGTFNYFTWLNGYSSNPSTSQTLRQGFSQGTNSLNPYTATTPWDLGILRAIYDSLSITDPATGDLISWLANSYTMLSNSQLGYTPPPGTVLTIRYQLRDDAYFQDGHSVTAWDVKFSYTTLDATGSYYLADLQSMICNTQNPPCVDGVTVVSPTTLDVHLTQSGIASNALISSVPILPGRYWSLNCPTTTWDGYVSSESVPDNCMSVDTNKADPGWDTIQQGNLIGSGPWMCRSASRQVGTGCSSSGASGTGPGNSITLTRFGIDYGPGQTTSGSYFRSSGTFALYLWSRDGSANDLNNISQVSLCYGQPVGTQACTHYQQGIGNPNGDGTTCCVVGSSRVSIVERFYDVPWLYPFSLSYPPGGVALPPMKLYEGPYTLLPGADAPAGCSVSFNNGGGYDC